MRVQKRLCNRDEPVKNKCWLDELVLYQDTAAPCVAEVHAERCEADPMYQLLLFPAQEIPVYSPATQQLLYKTTFIDRLLEGVHGMLRKRYGDHFQRERLLTEFFEQTLLKPTCDTQLKVFVLLFLIKWEPSVCELMRDLYDTEADSSLFGPEGIEQFNSLLKLLDRWVEQTVNYPFSQFSIVELVQNFLDACTREYIMGPFQ